MGDFQQENSKAIKEISPASILDHTRSHAIEDVSAQESWEGGCCHLDHVRCHAILDGGTIQDGGTQESQEQDTASVILQHS